MADYLASIYGTEKDKINCSFYYKMGACRHGDRCSRIHNKPSFSQTVLIQNLYVNLQNVAKAAGQTISDEENQMHFDAFFEDIYVELEDKYGPIEDMNICDNLGDHLIGNVYVMFKNEEDAAKAVEGLNNRWFDGKPVYAEFSTVTDFREAGCRQYDTGTCTRGGFCNFMHLKQISTDLKRRLFGKSVSDRSRRLESRSRSRSVSLVRRFHSRSLSRSRSRSKSPNDQSRNRRQQRSENRSSRRSHKTNHQRSERSSNWSSDELRRSAHV